MAPINNVMNYVCMPFQSLTLILLFSRIGVKAFVEKVGRFSICDSPAPSLEPYVIRYSLFAYHPTILDRFLLCRIVIRSGCDFIFPLRGPHLLTSKDNVDLVDVLTSTKGWREKESRSSVNKREQERRTYLLVRRI